MFRAVVVFLLLIVIKTFSRILFRLREEWVGDVPDDPWGEYRVVAILNHTSLFEVLYAGMPRLGFLWRLARNGLVPVADKTMRRPFVGKFFKLIGREVISLTRERDETWSDLLAKLGSDSMIILLPEGRMKRADGLDSRGKPMTVRGGIADVLRAIPEGRMLLAYSAGLHHIHVPGQSFPRLFKKVWMRFEAVDIPTYREEVQAASSKRFKLAVIDDLEKRRDRWCHPPTDQTTGGSIPLVGPGDLDAAPFVDGEGDEEGRDEEHAADQDSVLQADEGLQGADTEQADDRG